MSDKDTLLAGLSKELDVTNTIRDLVILKLNTAIQSNVNLLEMSPAQRESYMAIVRELNSTLNSRDSSHINKTKLRITADSNDVNTAAADVVSQLLQQLKLTTQPMGSRCIDPLKEAANLDEAFAKTGRTIREGETLTHAEAL